MENEYSNKLDKFLFKEIKDLKDLCIVEFGVRDGISTKKFLQSSGSRNLDLLSSIRLKAANISQNKMKLMQKIKSQKKIMIKRDKKLYKLLNKKY